MKTTRSTFTLLLVAATFGLTAAPDAQTPDFDQARDDTVAVLQDLIRLDTSSPPGNETLAAEYVKRALDAAEIPSRIVALDASRANLIGRLDGDGSKRPLLLMAHTDVVDTDVVNTADSSSNLVIPCITIPCTLNQLCIS